MGGPGKLLRRAIGYFPSGWGRAISWARLTARSPTAVLVMVTLTALSSAGGVWATPPTPEPGGSTIPIPPPVPPTPAPPTSEPTSPSTPEEIGSGFQVGILRLSPATTVLTLDGRRVEVSGGPIVVKVDSTGRQTIDLPIALPTGAKLGVFQDSISGMEWRPGPLDGMTGTLILPVAGAEASFVVFLEEVRGSGQRMEGVITKVELIMAPVSKGPGWFIIDGEVSFTAELSQLPRVVSIAVQRIDEANPELLSSLEETAGASQIRVDEVAYAVRLGVQLNGDEPDSMVRTVSINMTVASKWADRWPEGAVRIARIGDSGGAQILDTISTNTDALGKAGFLAVSPMGFSTFALVALKATTEGAQDGSFNWPLWLGVALASAALTLAGGLTILRFRAKLR